jgi:hypothetical protein
MDRQKKQAAKPQPKASFPGKEWTKTQRCRQVLETRVPYWQEGEVRPRNKEKENIQNERRQIERWGEGKGERERKKKVSLIIPTRASRPPALITTPTSTHFHPPPPRC